MAEFKSWGAFRQFEHATKHKRRYIHDPEVEAFLETVLQTASKRVEVLARESILWRAQLGCGQQPVCQDGVDIDVPAPHLPQRMTPQRQKASEGRANPKGIPYLYLATHHDTALAEVRPWIGSFISLGQFKTLRELRVVNCTTDEQGFLIYLEEPSAEKREESVWADIDRAFAQPVSPSDDIADYVSIQTIAELFKANGFDGVAYRSSLGEGHNVVLFYLDTAELVSCFLFKLECINFKFEKCGEPYFIRKHCDKEKP